MVPCKLMSFLLPRCLPAHRKGALLPGLGNQHGTLQITDPSDIWGCWKLLLLSSSHGESWFYSLPLISKGKLLTDILPFMPLVAFAVVSGGPCPVSAALFTRILPESGAPELPDLLRDEVPR